MEGMSDEDALLAAIAAHPDEDTPRLAYADWLDEHDRPIRAEFIRLQIEVARVETLPRIILNRHVDLFRRQQELLDNHRDELLGPLAVLPLRTKDEFYRGFVSEVTLHGYMFHKHRHLLAAARPLPRVVIEDRVDHIREVLGFRRPMVFPDEQPQIVAAFRTAPDEVDEEDEADFRQYVESGHVDLYPFVWSRLTELDISGCHLGDANATALLRSESFPALADLDISANDLTDNAVMNLLCSGLPPQLKRLILGGNPIGDAGAIALAERWPTGDADKLEHLNLRFTNIGQPGQQALLARFGGRVDLF